MSLLNAPIDYAELERDLEDSLRAEELYSLQNDAKFRAIEQAVPTYEDFREMVNAAHLKTLDRKDMTPKVGVQWNSVLNDKSRSQSSNQRSKMSIDRRPVTQLMPKNSHEFRQTWRKLVDNTEKLNLLNRARLVLRDRIFRSEIPPEILNEILRLFAECLETHENFGLIIDTLIALSECNRFQLAVSFMSAEDKSACRNFFRELRAASIAETKDIDGIIVDLEKKYVVG